MPGVAPARGPTRHVFRRPWTPGMAGWVGKCPAEEAGHQTMRGTRVSESRRVGPKCGYARTTREEAVGVAGRRCGAAAALRVRRARQRARPRRQNDGQGARRRLHTWRIEVRMA